MSKVSQLWGKQAMKDAQTRLRDMESPFPDGSPEYCDKLLIENHTSETPSQDQNGSKFRAAVGRLEMATYGRIQAVTPAAELKLLLPIYPLVCLIYTLADLVYGPKLTGAVPDAPSFWRASIARLDKALITSSGGDSADAIHETLSFIQGLYLPTNPPTRTNFRGLSPYVTTPPPLGATEVKRFSNPPSLYGFRDARVPFVIKGLASDWPALSKWSSLDYLIRVGGPGRVVPVEVGSDYTKDDWDQKMMDWEKFLVHIQTDEKPKLYLAQHSLFNQFPALREDIVIPNYVYSSPTAPEDYPTYKPPENDEELVLNAWLGPKGTISPAHTDPFYNCYFQVVGRKTVWLAPPSVGPWMEAHDSLLCNTSRIDVFSPTSAQDFPDYARNAMSEAGYTVLQPGDMLFFPPGWWHAMRSEDVSFSVSMWF